MVELDGNFYGKFRMSPISLNSNPVPPLPFRPPFQPFFGPKRAGGVTDLERTPSLPTRWPPPSNLASAPLASLNNRAVELVGLIAQRQSPAEGPIGQSQSAEASTNDAVGMKGVSQSDSEPTQTQIC